MEKEIYNMIANSLSINPTFLNAKTRLYGDLYTDSVTLWEIVTELEESYNIHIPDEEAEQWKNLGDIYRSVSTLTKF